MSEKEKVALALLKKRLKENDGKVNIEPLISENTDKKLKTAVVKLSYPKGKKVPPLELPLTVSSIKQLFESPAREKLVAALKEKNTIAWLFLESGNSKKDSAARTRLMEILDKMGTRNPQKSNSSASKSNSDDIAYSVIDIKYQDNKENYLVQSMLNSEPGLKKMAEPMAFPVFGRGRLLYALVGRGINEKTVADAWHFLTGPCSCQVKELNPGLDLLISADWENLSDPSVSDDEPLPPLAVVPVQTAEKDSASNVDSNISNNSPVKSKLPEYAESPVQHPASALSWWWTIIGVVIFIFIINFVLILYFKYLKP